mgnify:CR=1 FL=1
MKSAIVVIQEQIKYFYLIRRLSWYELKSKNKSNYLGIAWEVLNPSIQILIYWFVFGTINKRADVEVIPGMDVPFIGWLLGGFIIWNFFYQATIQGSKSIYTRLGMLSKMNFPMSVIPNFIMFSEFYVHLIMILITVILLQFMGFFINIYYLQLFYFVFATLALTFSIALITSTLSTIIRDVHMLLNSILRMLLYLTPVLWPMTSMFSDKILLLKVIKLNPLYYLTEGYRSSFFGTEWYFIDHWKYTLYFWVLVIVLFLLGSTLHVKFRRNFIDYL